MLLVISCEKQQVMKNEILCIPYYNRDDVSNTLD